MAAKKETELGLKKELEAALAVVFGPTFIIPLALLIIEKDKFVRFWAMQSLVLIASVVVLEMILTASIILIFLVPLVMLLAFLTWLVMVYKAWMGDMWEIPLVGKVAQALIKKI